MKYREYEKGGNKKNKTWAYESQYTQIFGNSGGLFTYRYIMYMTCVSKKHQLRKVGQQIGNISVSPMQPLLRPVLFWSEYAK